MKIKKTVLTLLIALAFTSLAFGACNPPEDPEIPDGARASGSDMLKAKKDVQTFSAAADAYMNCGVAGALKARMAAKKQKAVDKFNKELKAYKNKK